ncbi:MAG: TonB family protein [Pseudomonadota bacterium]
MKSWIVSLALHGTALGVALALWPAAAPEAEPEPLRWEVSLARPAVAPPAPPRPAGEPAPPAAPAPTVPSVAPPPEPLPAVRPAPSPPPEPGTPAPLASPSVPVASPAALPSAPPLARAAETVPVPPSAAPLPTPTQAPGEPVRAEQERLWQAALARRLRELRRYPPVARRLGQEGVVLLSVALAGDGRLEAVQVRQGSGYPILDRDALRLLEEAAALAREEMREAVRDGARTSLRLAIPIAYRLEN